jgi:hypothetical protein
MKDASRKPKVGRNLRGMREARLIPNMNLLKDNSQWSVSSDSIVWSLFNDLVSLYCWILWHVAENQSVYAASERLQVKESATPKSADYVLADCLERPGQSTSLSVTKTKD